MRLSHISPEEEELATLVRILAYAVKKLGGHMEVTAKEIREQFDPKVTVHYDISTDSYIVSSDYSDIKSRIIKDLEAWASEASFN